MFLSFFFSLRLLAAATPDDFKWKKRLIVVSDSELVLKQYEVFKRI